jgi:hypothetical protein
MKYCIVVTILASRNMPWYAWQGKNTQLLWLAPSRGGEAKPTANIAHYQVLSLVAAPCIQSAPIEPYQARCTPSWLLAREHAKRMTQT